MSAKFAYLIATCLVLANLVAWLSEYDRFVAFNLWKPRGKRRLLRKFFCLSLAQKNYEISLASPNFLHIFEERNNYIEKFA